MYAGCVRRTTRSMLGLGSRYLTVRTLRRMSLLASRANMTACTFRFFMDYQPSIEYRGLYIQYTSPSPGVDPRFEVIDQIKCDQLTRVRSPPRVTATAVTALITFFNQSNTLSLHAVTPHYMPDLDWTFLARFWRHLTSTRVAYDAYV